MIPWSMIPCIHVFVLSYCTTWSMIPCIHVFVWSYGTTWFMIPYNHVFVWPYGTVGSMIPCIHVFVLSYCTAGSMIPCIHVLVRSYGTAGSMTPCTHVFVRSYGAAGSTLMCIHVFVRSYGIAGCIMPCIHVLCDPMVARGLWYRFYRVTIGPRYNAKYYIALAFFHLSCSIFNLWRAVEEPEFTLVFRGIRVARFFVFHFVLFLLTIVLSVLQFKGRRDRNRMVVGFTTTYAISAYHH
jgi:hypothetical protein